MTVHALAQPIMVHHDGVEWDTACKLCVRMPKQKFKAGTAVTINDGQTGHCPVCFAEEERRTPEQIEAAHRRAEELGGVPVTFDESVGEIEENDEIGGVEDDEGLGGIEEEEP